MSEISTTAPAEPLGIGIIISESFSILFDNFFKVLILGFALAFVEFLVVSVFLGLPVAVGGVELEFESDLGMMFTGVLFAILLILLINVVVYGLMTAVMIQLTSEAKLGNSATLWSCVSSAVPVVLPIAVLSVFVGVLSMFGALAFVVGAFWVYGVFYLVAPCAVIERAGFASLGRSAELTKNYRWPIVGLTILLFVIFVVVQMVVEGMLAGLLYFGSDPFGSLAGSSFSLFALAYGFITALFSGLLYGLSGISVTLVYLRLRQIKSGTPLDEVAAIFD